MDELALFAGAGGGILGGRLLGWRTVCAVEIDPYCREVLLRRQLDGCLPRFPIWDDVRTFDGRPWRGIIDVISGGFPCQDISCAGKGAGIEGQKSGLWKEMARIIGEVRPQYVFVENSPLLVRRGLTTVLGDLATMGYDAKWGVLGASDVGAPHKRERIWILADSHGAGCEWQESAQPTGWDDPPKFVGASAIISDSGNLRCAPGRPEQPLSRSGLDGQNEYMADAKEQHGTECRQEAFESGRCDWWKAEPDVGRMVDGLAFRVDRLKALGNGQVPSVVRLAWGTLSDD